MRLSGRAALLRPMELARLRRLAREAGALDIAIGVPWQGPSKAVLAAAVAAMAGDRHQYVESAGVAELRSAIAEDRKRCAAITVDPVSEVTVTCGAIEALLVSLLATTEPGDEVLIPEPYYESYPGAVRMAGAIPVAVPLSPAGWKLDIGALSQAITPRTRAIILNSPHNPTGRVFTFEEMTDVVSLCDKHDLVCITDEVYDHYVYDGRPMVSGWSVPGARARVIVTGGLSKTLRITGWRIGYCIADQATSEVLRRVRERTTIGAATPLQYGAAALGAYDEFHDLGDITESRNLLVQRLERLGFEVRRPEGGWFVLAGTGELGLSSGELSASLIEKAGVLVAPGAPFFADPADGTRWVRATFVRDRATLTAALDRITVFLEGTSQRTTRDKRGTA